MAHFSPPLLCSVHRITRVVLSMSSGKLNWHVVGILVELCVLYPLCGSVINHYIANIPYQTVWDISLTLLTIVSSGVIMLLFPIFHNIRRFDIYCFLFSTTSEGLTYIRHVTNISYISG